MFHLHRLNNQNLLFRTNGVSDGHLDFEDGAEQGRGDVMIRSHVTLSHMACSGIPVEPSVAKLSSRSDFYRCGHIHGVLADWVTNDGAATADLGC